MLGRIILGVLFYSAVAFGAPNAPDAWRAFYHRQYSIVRDYCAQSSSVDAELLCIRFTVNEADVSVAAKALEQLLRDHGNDARVQFDAGALWKTIGRRDGFFSRKSYIEKSVAAYKKAAELEPSNARYIKEAALAYAYNGSFFSVDLVAQRQFIDKMKMGDPRYYLMAQMDYAQNAQNKTLANSLVDEARIRFSSDIDVMERAAQLLWTNDNVAMAQQTFHAVCLLEPGENYLWEKWLSSCEISAMLAKKGEAVLAIGLASSQRIIDFDPVHDDYYADNMLVHAELLHKSGRLKEATRVLEQLISLAATPSTIETAQQWLRRWRKSGTTEQG